MNGFVAQFISSYLLLPLTAIVLGAFVCVVSKKNKLLSNKKAIFYILLGGIILGLPGLLGFMNYTFMPYMYGALVCLYLLLGYYNQAVMLHFLRELKNKPFIFRFMFNFAVMTLGLGLFSLFFNLLNELNYGLWACTCVLPFMFPMLYNKMQQCYMEIPPEIYKVWKYSDEYDSETFHIDLKRIRVVDLELFRKVYDIDSERITGKVADDSVFGQWFQCMIDDCNRKSPLNPIMYRDGENCYEWIFYTKPSFFQRRKYIDPDLTFAENGLKQGCVIIAKRVVNEQYEN